MDDFSTPLVNELLSSEPVFSKNKHENFSAELGLRDKEENINIVDSEELDEQSEGNSALEAVVMAEEVKNSKEWGIVSDVKGAVNSKKGFECERFCD